MLVKGAMPVKVEKPLDTFTSVKPKNNSQGLVEITLLVYWYY